MMITIEESLQETSNTYIVRSVINTFSNEIQSIDIPSAFVKAEGTEEIYWILCYLILSIFFATK